MMYGKYLKKCLTQTKKLLVLIFIFSWVFSGFPPETKTVEALATSVKYVGTGVDGNNAQNCVWVNPTNAQGDTTATSASCEISGNGNFTNTLILTNFGFNAGDVPANSAINGITVEVEWQGTDSSIIDTTVQITKNASSGIGTNKALGTSQISKGFRTYGGSSDTWTATPTQTDVTSSNFGIILVYQKSSGGPKQSSVVFRTRMTIEYTPPITTIADGTNPSNSTVGPGTAITDLDTFTLITTNSTVPTDSVTALTVTLGPAGAFNNIGEVRITNNAGTVTYFSAVSNPASNTVNFSSGTPIPVTTSVVPFKVRITPKTHANMPAVPGASYNTTGTVTAFTSTKAQAGSDSASATITVDNESPGAVTGTSGTPGDTQVQLDWTNPSDSDFTTGGQVVVLRRAGSAVVDVPAEGGSYSVGNIIGSATVACVVSGSPPATTCTDTGLTNETAYHYKKFTKDSRGNYNAGTVPTGSPYTPTSGVTTLTQNYFRFYVDNDALDPTDPWPSGAVDLGENTEITASNDPPASGEQIRLRTSIAVSGNTLAASAQDFKMQFGTRVTTCSAIGTWTDLGAPASGAIWRGFNATPADGTNLSINPPTAGDLNLSVSDRAGTYEEQNNTTLNPFQVAVGEDVEYDWNIENNSATGATEYCFRMVKSDATALDGYNFYPAVITSGFRPESQNWRWYDDETNETPTSALAAENVAPSNIVNQNSIKLRLTIADTAGVAGTNIRFKVQFSEFSDFSSGVTDAVEIGSCTTSSLWCYADGVDTDDTTITTSVLTDSTANGTHNESGTAASTFDPAASTATEYEFTIKHSGARVNTTYFFRAFDVTNNLAVPLNTSETYPSLSTEGATLTFTIAGLAASTVTEGITTDITTTPTSVPFSAVSFGTETEAAQRITVDANSTEGYQVFVFERQGLLHEAYGGVLISAITGTNASPSGWTTGCAVAAKGCYGYHAGDDTLEGGSTRFSANDTYAQFTTSAEEVTFNSGPVVNEVTDIIYKLQVTNQQESGNYSSSIVYIVVPTF